MMTAKKISILFIFWMMTGCITNPDTERFADTIGEGQVDDVNITINLGTFALVNDTIVSNIQKPNIDIHLQSNSNEHRTIVFKLHNMRNSVLPSLSPDNGMVRRGVENKTVIYTVNVQPNEEFSVSLTSFSDTDTYTFAAVGDIQLNKDAGRKIVEDINSRGGIDFIMILGDLTMGGNDEFEWGYDLLNSFDIPAYLVIGNHDLGNTIGINGDGYEMFRTQFGKTNYSFEYNNDLFLILDSADQGISREVYNYAKKILSQGSYRKKFVFQHIPAFEESGIRNASFNTSYDAARYMNMVSNSNVDIIFSGHVHTYQDFTIAGVRNVIAGMGGGAPELMDGIENGYILVTSDESGVNI